MNINVLYKGLILLGIFVFVIGIIGDSKAIPYLRHGAIIGPLLFTLGTMIWIPIRLKKPIIHTYEYNSYKSEFDAMIAFLFNNFVLEFWAFCCAMAMLMIVGGGSLLKDTNGYKIAIDAIKNDSSIQQKIGDYQATGVLIGGTVSQTKVKLGFSAYGSTGGTPVNIEMEKQEDEWNLISIELN